MSRRTTAGITVTALLVMAACSQGKQADKSRAPAQSASEAAGAAAASKDSVAIRTTDGAIQLGLARDTVYMGLTDSVLTLARKDMARDTEETRNAIAGTIERFVKKSVSSALQTRLKYPLADLDSVTYRDGAIKFAYRDKRRMGFEDVSQNGHKALQSFTPDDAQHFVSVVNSAIRESRGSFQ
jgi:hypothetical protein